MRKITINGQKTSQQKPKISAGDSNLVIRRSITIEDGLNTYINTLRARYLEHAGQEIDFTTMMNALAAIGALRISKYKEMSQKEIETYNTYLDLADLQIEGSKDVFQDQWLKHELPKFAIQGTDKQNTGNSVKGKKSEDIHEPA